MLVPALLPVLTFLVASRAAVRAIGLWLCLAPAKREMLRQAPAALSDSQRGRVPPQGHAQPLHQHIPYQRRRYLSTQMYRTPACRGKAGWYTIMDANKRQHCEHLGVHLGVQDTRPPGWLLPHMDNTTSEAKTPPRHSCCRRNPSNWKQEVRHPDAIPPPYGRHDARYTSWRWATVATHAPEKKGKCAVSTETPSVPHSQTPPPSNCHQRRRPRSNAQLCPAAVSSSATAKTCRKQVVVRNSSNTHC